MEGFLAMAKGEPELVWVPFSNSHNGKSLNSQGTGGFASEVGKICNAWQAFVKLNRHTKRQENTNHKRQKIHPPTLTQKLHR